MRLLKFLLFLAFLYLLAHIAVKGFKIYYEPKNLDIVYKYSSEYDLDPALVLAIIHAESKFEQYAVSSKGASGYMQLMEGTADWISENIKLENYSYDNIFDPEINIQLGSWYIKNLLQQFNDLNTAIVAYNAGSGNVSRWLEEQNISKIDEENIPFEESKTYLKRVLFNYKIYKQYWKYIGE